MKEISEKEYGTIIYALEEYQDALEREGSISARNYVIDLIHKVCDIKGESK